MYMHRDRKAGAVLGKNILGVLAPHHLGGNNEQNYCIQLSSIKQLMYRNYPENLEGPGQDLGGLCLLAQHRTATAGKARHQTVESLTAGTNILSVVEDRSLCP